MDGSRKLISISEDVFRSIPTIAKSQSLFDDLSDDVADMAVATSLEMTTKMGRVSPGPSVIHRPFDQAEWLSVIGWPFANIGSSRLSTGAYGVWYGSKEQETSVMESLFYAVKGFHADYAGGKHPTRVDRRVYRVHLERGAVDMTSPAKVASQFSDPDDWGYAQAQCSRIRGMGFPGVLYRSARCEGLNVGMFSPEGLTNPQQLFDVSFTWEGGNVVARRGESVIAELLV